MDRIELCNKIIFKFNLLKCLTFKKKYLPYFLMAKEILAQIKLQIEAGKANPAPPVGPALGQRQVNIMDFCKQFNDRTKSMAGLPCPTIIVVYKDKSFDFVVKKPPVTYYIKKIAKVASGSKTAGRGASVAIIKKKDLEEAVKEKMCDLNCYGDIEAGIKMFIGTARSMGIKVEE